jgi:hypothetical protein
VSWINLFALIQELQVMKINQIWLQLSTDKDVESKDISDAKILFDVLSTFEFILGMVIQYEILFTVNKVSKQLQSPS